MARPRKSSPLKTPPHTEVFSFGDPVPVLDRHEVRLLLHADFNGRWYEPPVCFDGLSKAFQANTHHESAIRFKANMVSERFNPSPLLSRHDFKRLILAYLLFGNLFAEVRRNRLGRVMQICPLPARWMRVMKRKGATARYMLLSDGTEHELSHERVIHVREPDINQEIYGLPQYLSALQSAFLNEAATLFRRKYYLNGSHAGFILYISDPAYDPSDIDSIREELKNARGPGNFRNLFMYAPGGKKDGIQLIPISEVAAKDEFLHIKNITRDDVLAAHRVPPQLLGVVPINSGGFGSIRDAADIFARHEIKPMMATFLEINDQLGQPLVQFREDMDNTP